MMEIFFDHYKSKKSNLKRGICEYQPYHQNSYGQQQNRIYKRWNDFWNFCGAISVSENISVQNKKLIQPNSFNNNLVKLERTTNTVICKLCSRKFELRRSDDQISIYKYQCSTNVGKPCICCYSLEKTKNYSQCKKCSLKLFFFPQGFTLDQIQCSRCNLKHCLNCKNAITHFSTVECKCRLIKVEQKIRFLKTLLLLDVIFTISGLILMGYLEKSEYYESIKCSVKNWFQDPSCAGEQVMKDVKKMIIIMTGSLVVIAQGLTIVELISKLIRQSQKWTKIKTDRPQLWRGR